MAVNNLYHATEQAKKFWEVDFNARLLVLQGLLCR
jgi:hypothetical protein